MEKHLSLLLFLLLLTSCNSVSKENKYFIELLDKAYKVKSKNIESGIWGFIFKSQGTCIYGVKPNNVAKERIDRFYKLINSSINEMSAPKYVKNIEECPKDTRIFVLIHENLERPSDTRLLEENRLRNFLKISKPAKVRSLLGSGIAKVTRIKGGEPGVVFVSFNQLSRLIKLDKIYIKLVKSVIMEELFQAVSSGNDVVKINKRMSILHEPALNQIKVKTPPYFATNHITSKTFKPFFEVMLEEKPIGLCSFDLWFLLLADKAKDKKIGSFKNYIKTFEGEKLSIFKRATEIENNLVYKDLFDPRCSGKNTGINTKIGVE